MTFQDLNLTPPLYKALDELGFKTPTPIQQEAFNVVTSGSDVVGIAQTGTGKTLAYLLPILKQLPFSNVGLTRVLILEPTRELVVQVVNEIELLSKYITLKTLGVYGGVNINTQKQTLSKGVDILVATPGRVFDLAVSHTLQLKAVKQLVIDEVDIMLDLGFRHQLLNIFDLLPTRRQNIMFSATMTLEADNLIRNFFKSPKKVSVALSGEPLVNIVQERYFVDNFHTKFNLATHLLEDTLVFNKVLLFASTKKIANAIFEFLDELFVDDCAIIHSNKTQNYRLNSIALFKNGDRRILITTDLMSRGLDIDNISHVINFDTPLFPENYIHRIGRTGRANKMGFAITFSSKTEETAIKEIENYMNLKINVIPFPDSVEISKKLIEEERPIIKERHNPLKRTLGNERNSAFQSKKEKNIKKNLGGSYREKIKQKYKKPKTRGDKRRNNKK